MEDLLTQFKLQPGQMPGLIGQVKNNPQVGGFLSDLAEGALGGGGGKKKGGIDFGSMLGGFGKLIGGKKKSSGGGGGDSGGGSSLPAGGGGGQPDIGALIGGMFGGGSAAGGGPNSNVQSLIGGMLKDRLPDLIGQLGHRFFGVDPNTGRMIGSIAGNVIFGLGGKDNSLGNLGKIILDNIISGKFKRDVDPYVPTGPVPCPAGPDNRPCVAGPQDFNSLRDQCLKEQRLFEDEMFPAADSSLFFSKPSSKPITWLRPGEICEAPQLFTEGHSRFDVIQGELGDCWMLAAVASLTLRDELFYRVVPPDQSFTENYCGIFHFQFWQYGRWVDVVIDDRVPTYNGKLLYLHSANCNEFWPALLEKAYAKLNSSYEALKGGSTSEALEDFTGGLTEMFNLREATPPNLLQMMFKAFQMGSLLGCSIPSDVLEGRLTNGLVTSHAYSITGLRNVNTNRGPVSLIRIRNPWGNETEWNGAWSDNSNDWSSVSEEEKQEMGLVREHDGEFWMSYDDFKKNWVNLEICNLGPDVMEEVYQMTGAKLNQGQGWTCAEHDGAWICGVTAGGCRNKIDTFAINPQFRVELTDADVNDNDDFCTIIIGVLQKNRRQLRSAGLDLLAIGFAVYKADSNPSAKLDRGFFERNKAVARSSVFINLREVCNRFRLPPGSYVIVPSTYNADEEGEFMVRIFTDGPLDSEALG